MIPINSPPNIQKLTVSFLYQQGNELDTNQIQTMKQGTVIFNFDKNIHRVVKIDLAKFQLAISVNNVYRFRDAKQKIVGQGEVQKFIEVHIKDSVGKYNATTGIQDDILGYIPLSPVEILTYTSNPVAGYVWDKNYVQYIYDALKAPIREEVVISKGATNFMMYVTSQQNDLLDLSIANYFYVEFDVFYV